LGKRQREVKVVAIKNTNDGPPSPALCPEGSEGL